MGGGRVLPRKVHPALALEELCGVVQLLVGCVQGKGPQAVGVQAPLLHQAPRPERPDGLPVDLHQVFQDQRHHILLAHALEEGGVVGACVGCQEGSGCRAGEAMTGGSR